MLDVYLFHGDESATLLNDPIGQVPDDTEEFTIDQLRELCINVFNTTGVVHSFTNEEMLTWSKEQIGNELYETACLIMDSAALVDPKHAANIHDRGEKLYDRFGGDSSTYQACADFAWYLKDKAVRVIDFPLAEDC